MKNIFNSSLIGFLTGFINGLFGSGGGTILVPALQKILKVDTHKSHATAIAIIFPLSLLSTFIYLKNIQIDIKMVFHLSVGGVIGGYIGANLLTRISPKILRKCFGIFMVVASLRMIL